MRSVFNLIVMTIGLQEAKHWIEREKRDRWGKIEGLGLGKTKRTTITTTTTLTMIAIITIIVYYNNSTNCRVYFPNLP